MKIRIKANGTTGHAHTFNTAALAEVIVYYDEGDADSCFIKDLDVLLPTGWKDLGQAFKDRDLITDNFNTMFFAPSNEADKVRGFAL